MNGKKKWNRLFVYSCPDGDFRFVLESAGTGESTILRALSRQMRVEGVYEWVILALPGGGRPVI